MKHLWLSIWGQMDAGDKRHPQHVIRDLGISYQFAVPQSISDTWQFFNCKNIPDELPAYVKYFEVPNPDRFVGYGLSQEMADALKNKSVQATGGSK